MDEQSNSSADQDAQSAASSSSGLLALNESCVPAELRAIHQWVAWRAVASVKRPGRLDKIPIDPKNGSNASTTGPETWSTFESAVQRARAGGLAGVGFVLTKAIGVVGIDLDHCRDPQTGTVEPWAMAIVSELDTYTEVSPSGTGVHAFAFGGLPAGGRHKGKIEMYDWGRFLTVTGLHVAGTPKSVEARMDALGDVHARELGRSLDRGPSKQPIAACALDEDALLAHAREQTGGDAFDRLWSGATSGFESPSEADFALCVLLARAGGEAERIDALFRKSGLMRDKWDEPRGDETYGRLTIGRAIAAAADDASGLRRVALDTPAGALQFEYRLQGSNGRVLMTVRTPSGESIVDKFDVTSAAARGKFAEVLTSGIPSASPELVRDTLGRIADDVVTALSAVGDARDGRDGFEDKSQADVLVALASGDDVELFHTPGRQDVQTFARVSVDGHMETLPVPSRAFRYWLLARYDERYRKVPAAQPLADALHAIAGKALLHGSVHQVWVRVAEHEGATWLDLCDDEWRAIRITAGGWAIVSSDEVPVRFVRKRGMQALPPPERGGSMDELRQLVNLPDEASWVLCLACLVAWLQSRGPYPLLVASGEQGSAKSTLCRFLRGLIDPSKAPLRRLPKNDRDLMIAAGNAWLLAFDNLSGIKPDLSDALCSLSTGGGLGTRELYSDDDEKLFDAMRPSILNGIDDLATRPDLLDRSVVLMLPSIAPEDRVEEAKLHARFEAARPRLLGALLDAACVVLRERANVHLAALPRMADFAITGTAAEAAFGWEPGTFMRHYAGNRADATTLALEGSPIGGVLIEFVRVNGSWQGTSKELLSTLDLRVSDRVRQRPDWPRKPQMLATELRQITPSLRSIGIDVRHSRAPGGMRERRIHLDKIDPEPSRPSRPSRNGTGEAENAFEAGRLRDGSSPEEGASRPADSSLPGSETGVRDGRDARDGFETALFSATSDKNCAVDCPAVAICRACTGQQWWRRAEGGEWICRRCHEPPNELLIVTWPGLSTSRADDGEDAGGAE